ncbi:uncharacterized protein LOC113317742 [Papaver somniferum]|uniref:uncharacterized protein LOC113317742 n=1 Tax=Papaver somniferum TaxID=3469 RepID=UPI000E701E52|nr:uncharacterized protein LOC113317742 [Papaver somniferum]XP_026421668.1 uncharacterized protein LOC113317742 [Papaver somniferum]
MRMWNSESRIEDIDLNAQDFWIKFELGGDLVEKGYVAKQVAEKVGRVFTLIGPLNSQEEYQAHVLTDLKKILVHQVKIIILDGLDRDIIKTRIFFMVIPHGTCRRCWFVDGDHSEEKCRQIIIAYKNSFPKVYVYNKEVEDAGSVNEEFHQQDAQNGNRMKSLATAAASLQIYDNEFDKVDYQTRGVKRRRIDNDYSFNEEENESGRSANVGIIGDGRRNASEGQTAITVISEERDQNA